MTEPLTVDSKLTERERVLIEFIINRHLTHLPFSKAVLEAMTVLNDMDELALNRLEDEMMEPWRRSRHNNGSGYSPWGDMI